jgi:hypothetical protein
MTGCSVDNEWTGKFDAKDYPVSGDLSSDKRSYTKIDGRTMGFNVKEEWQGTISGRIAVSADGKTRTVTTSVTDKKGKKISSVAVYEKQ